MSRKHKPLNPKSTFGGSASNTKADSEGKKRTNMSCHKFCVVMAVSDGLRSALMRSKFSWGGGKGGGGKGGGGKGGGGKGGGGKGGGGRGEGGEGGGGGRGEGGGGKGGGGEGGRGEGGGCPLGHCALHARTDNCASYARRTPPPPPPPPPHAI